MKKIFYFGIAVSLCMISFFFGLKHGQKRGFIVGLDIYNKLSYDEIRALREPHAEGLFETFLRSKERERILIDQEIQSFLIPISFLDLREEGNGIWLPGKAGGGATKTVHAGKHEAYSDAMYIQMNKFLNDSGMQLSNPNTWTKQALDVARSKIAQMQNRARHALNEGRIPLIQRFEGEEIKKEELIEKWIKIFEDVP